MKDFQEKITFEIDEHRLGIFVAAFGAAASQRLLRRPNINISRPIFRRAQAFYRENQFARQAREIPFSDFIDTDRPGSTLHDDAPASQTRCLRYKPEVKRMKSERNNPVARKRSQILALGTKSDIAIFFDNNLGLRWNN